MSDSVKQSGQAGTENEVTPAMLAAGIDAFWSMAEDRFANTYDAGPFVTKLYLLMREAHRLERCEH